MIYASQYRHLVLAGRTRDGREVVLAAGQAEPDFPYPAEGFDSVLLMVGEQRMQRTSRELGGLELPMLVPDEVRELALALELRDAAPGGPAGRGLTMVEASIPLRLGHPHVAHLGPQAWFGTGMGLVPGMKYAAMVVDIPPKEQPWIRLDGVELKLDPLTVTGQIEWGDAIGYSPRNARCGFQYRCAVEPAGDRVRVDLATHSLYADGWISRTVDLIADATSTFSLIGARHRGGAAPAPELMAPGARLGLTRVERLVSAPVRLGHADVDRALCRYRDAEGRTLVGLEASYRPVDDRPGYPAPE